MKEAPAGDTDWRVLRVFGNDGNTYYYGPFMTRGAALRFAEEECKGFRFEVDRLMGVERDYNRI